jgi:hypothetical protein
MRVSKAEWFIVRLNGREIDKMSFTGYTAEEARRSLIDHDGYDPRITVTKEGKIHGS